MPETAPRLQDKKFSSPEEELKYLRERVKSKEKELEVNESKFERERIAAREVADYANKSQKDVLHETNIVPAHDAMREALGLDEEEHDAQIDGLLKIVSERGIKNALTVAQRMQNPHIEDDFHRTLVRYVAEGLPVGKNRFDTQDDVWRAVHQTLFEIEPPGARDEEDGEEPLEKMLASMEQLYAGLTTIARDARGGTYSLEIATQQGTENVHFYISVPRSKAELFERHALSIFPGAKITEQRGDYNTFAPDGAHVGAIGSLKEHPSLPIRDYHEFEYDPMNIILSAFSKLKKHGDGAALQIVVGNSDGKHNRHYKKILREINKGKSFKKAIGVPETMLGEAARDFGKGVVTAFFPDEKKDEHKEPDQDAAEHVSKKLETQIAPATLRLVASAKDDIGADNILDNLISTFSQFDDPKGNGFVFEKLHGGKLQKLLRNFSFRMPNVRKALPLSIRELTTLFHLSAEGVSTSRELKKSKSKEAPAPVDMPIDGILLGKNSYGGAQTDVRFSPEDRLRHFYCVGQTGAGKSNFLKYMMIQDIKNGEGLCYIDPHGEDIQDVLAAVPAHRQEDLIYFGPSYTPMPMGLNMLEYDIRKPEQKTFVVDELFGIFNKLYGHVEGAVGPAFEQYFRNATLLVMEDPATGNTMVDITRIFANKQFRDMKLARCGNPLVVQFFRDIASKTEGEHSFANFAQYVTNKFDVFLANEIMRPIISQERSAFNFRDIMDNKKILLVNLSKGMLGDMNAHLLGLVIVGKILLAALSRADSENMKELPPFYLYLDEFQNITTPSIATILSEARKYKLALTVAHQYIDQLDEDIRDAVFGNVGSKAAFRVGIDDAEFLQKAFEPEFKAKDLANLDNFNAYMAMLIGGKPAKPFSMKTLPVEDIDFVRAEEYKQASYKKYGRPRAEVEAEIQAKYQQTALNPQNLQENTPQF